jgi:hypothetical protein
MAFISIAFFSALLSALASDLTLDCGCFGSDTPSRPGMWLELGLDLVLLSSSFFIYSRALECLPCNCPKLAKHSGVISESKHFSTGRSVMLPKTISQFGDSRRP